MNRYPKGQGALVAVALVVLAGLVAVGLSISNLGSLNSKRSLAVEYSLETYYCALSGRQEALSTRMVPRSNRLALSGAENNANKPFNKQSGYCYLNPNGASSSGVLGLYRYLIVGGDPARDPNNGNWFDINQQPNNVIKQPFYIISQGAVCRDNTTKEAKVNAISFNSVTKDVQCGVGQSIDRLTTVTEVDFSRQSGNKDKVNNFQVVQDPNNIALQEPAWTPCQNVTQNVNFNTAYGCGTFPSMHHVSFYLPGASAHVNSVQSPFTSNPTIPANALIRLFFEGPVDYRTFFAGTQTPISQCLSNPSFCNVKLLKITTAPTPAPGVTQPPPGELMPPNTLCTQGPCTFNIPGQGQVTFQNGDSIQQAIFEGGQQLSGDRLSSGGGIYIPHPPYLGGGGSSGTIATPVSVQILPLLGASTQLVLFPIQPLAEGDYQISFSNLKDYSGNSLNGSISIPFSVAPPAGIAGGKS